MNERLPSLDRKYMGLGNKPMIKIASIDQPTTIYRVNGERTRTIVRNNDKLPISVNVIGGSRSDIFVEAGKGKGNTSITMEGGIDNQVVVWNPHRAPVDVDLQGSLTRVKIYIPRTEQSAQEYKRRKVRANDRKMKRENVKIEEYDLDNLPRLQD